MHKKHTFFCQCLCPWVVKSAIDDVERITGRADTVSVSDRGGRLFDTSARGEDVVLLLDAGDSHGDRELSDQGFEKERRRRQALVSAG